MKYKVVDKIKKKGYPTASKKYPEAHRAANQVEKKKYPQGYEEMKKIDAKLPNNEEAGTHTKSGKIKVSKKVPPKDRQEVATHEYVEWKKDPGSCAICGKGKPSHR